MLEGMKRTFKYVDGDCAPGQLIEAKEDHIGELSPAKQRAERAIREGDPRGSLRASAIYVFEDRAVAEALLHHTPGQHLYEMEVDDADILHRADLRIYDEIVDALARGRPTQALVKEFWSGTERPHPRIELAVSKARVVRKMVDKHDKPTARGRPSSGTDVPVA